jgi:hypothetical protein
MPELKVLRVEKNGCFLEVKTKVTVMSEKK